MNPVRIAVIGAGHLGRIHIKLLKTAPGVQFVAVADPVAEARQRVADEFGLPAFANYRDLIGYIDAAIVVAPTTLHHRIGGELLAAGIHTFIEKPLAPSVPEADDLIQLAEERGLVLQVGHVERFNPAFVALEPLVSEPRFIEASRSSGFTFRSTDIGVVHDLMIHDIDLVLALVRSEVTDVAAVGFPVVGPREDVAQARLTFANGCIATLNASRVSFEAERTMRLFTPQHLARLDFATGVVKLARNSERLLSRDLDLESLNPLEREQLKKSFFSDLLPMQEVPVEPRNAILDEQFDFIESIATGREPRVTGRQAREALSVSEWILSSIAEHSARVARLPAAAPVSIPFRRAG